MLLTSTSKVICFPVGARFVLTLALLGVGYGTTIPLAKAQKRVTPKRGVVKKENPSAPTSVAKEFLSSLMVIGTAPPRTGDLHYSFPPSSPVSRKSVFELSGGVIDQALEHMASLLVVDAHFTAQLLKPQSSSSQAHVKVMRDETAHPREVVLIREYGIWKVDVLATYAIWNKLSQKEAKKRLQT